jgi:hypothetical protein
MAMRRLRISSRVQRAQRPIRLRLVLLRLGEGPCAASERGELGCGERDLDSFRAVDARLDQPGT